MKYVVIATFTAKAGARDALADALTQNAAIVRAAEPECLQIDLLLPQDGSESCTLYEVYASEAAFAAHMAMPYGPDLYARIQPHLDGAPSGTRYWTA